MRASSAERMWLICDFHCFDLGDFGKIDVLYSVLDPVLDSVVGSALDPVLDPVVGSVLDSVLDPVVGSVLDPVV